MIFGLPTLIECRDIDECSDLASRLGLDFVEINMSFPRYLPEVLPQRHLDALRQKNGIGYTVHINELCDPFEFDGDVSAAYFTVVKKSISFANSLGIKVVNMHLCPGVYVTLPEKRVYLYDVYRDAYIDKVKRFAEMCAITADSGLKICIENTNTPKAGWTDACRAAVDTLLEYDCFGLTLDTGHDFIANGGDGDVFEKYADRLHHIHLHDAAKERGPHLPLGEGNADIEEFLRLAEMRNATCLLEVKTIDGLEKSVNYLKDKGYIR